jgi:hypothetical protein
MRLARSNTVGRRHPPDVQPTGWNAARPCRAIFAFFVVIDNLGKCVLGRCPRSGAAQKSPRPSRSSARAELGVWQMATFFAPIEVGVKGKFRLTLSELNISVKTCEPLESPAETSGSLLTEMIAKIAPCHGHMTGNVTMTKPELQF